MKKYFALICLVMIAFPLFAQTIEREEDVPPYQLPELLVSESGKTIANKQDWEKIRKPELLAIFEREMFGAYPAVIPIKVEFIPGAADRSALGGLATRKEVVIRFSNGERNYEASMLIYLPNAAKKPAPVFMGLNFPGNHTVDADPGITMGKGIDGKVAPRGAQSGRWQVEELIKNGYGLVTACYTDLEPDRVGGLHEGFRSLMYSKEQEPTAGEWGALAAWGWVLSRMMDYAVTDPAIDAKKVALIGHSRLGKAALWAGVTDPRFAIVISNNSGCGGAALSKRIFGETVGVINKAFPHWFCGNYKNYSNQEAKMPFDQHQLLALIAPRPLYVASAAEDLWADPVGEQLSAFYASPVYALYKLKGLTEKGQPEVNQPVMNRVGYHVRSGVHDVTLYDWQQYIAFAGLHFNRK